MLDNTQHLYPPSTPTRDPLNILHVGDEMAITHSHATNFSHNDNPLAALSEFNNGRAGMPLNKSSSTPSKSATRPDRNILVIDGENDLVEEVVLKEAPRSPTKTNWTMVSSSKLSVDIPITVTFWFQTKNNKRKRTIMKSISLCARKDGTFVIGDHKMIVFEVTGLVVYDDIEVRQDHRWIETTWYTAHNVVAGGRLVLRTPGANTRKWQVDA